MNEKVPIPIEKLHPQAKRVLIGEYYNLCLELLEKVEMAASSRVRSQPGDTPNTPLVIGVHTDPADYAVGDLFSARSDADGLTFMFHELFEEHGESFWEVYKDDLADFLERLIHCKYECEGALLIHKMDLEDSLQAKNAEA